MSAALSTQERIILDCVVMMARKQGFERLTSIERELILAQIGKTDAGTSPMGGVLLCLADWLKVRTADLRESNAFHQLWGAVEYFLARRVEYFLARRVEQCRRSLGENIGGE